MGRWVLCLEQRHTALTHDAERYQGRLKGTRTEVDDKEANVPCLEQSQHNLSRQSDERWSGIEVFVGVGVQLALNLAAGTTNEHGPKDPDHTQGPPSTGLELFWVCSNAGNYIIRHFSQPQGLSYSGHLENPTLDDPVRPMTTKPYPFWPQPYLL